ncbi:hypothetical protein DH86_00001933 [Scytalidium sp. 3C]|nr:hypothetical protein DH86_00001933 [Scytalidium sp. 3C]
MSIIQQITADSLTDNWRTINIDALDPDSSLNFDTTTLHPAFPPVSEAEIRTLAGQVRQLLRGGDAEGALRGALENVPYGGDQVTKSIYSSEGGSEVLDVLMKYIYKGMGSPSSARGKNLTPEPTGAAFSQIGARPGAPSDSSGASMSVLLSWHEKVVEVAGLGSIARCMTDWRKV